MEIEEKQEQLNKDFMVIKRNTVDEMLKEVEINKYPMSKEIEQTITDIISLRLERSLSAPSRIGIKVWNNMTNDPEYQSNIHTLASIENSKNIINFSGIFNANTELSDNFARITTRSTRHPDKTISTGNKTLTSTSMKWNQRS